jgi:PTS system nitrogen regulatory IIA component
MDQINLISPEAVFIDADAGSKKQLLEDLANKASALTGIDARKIFTTVIAREKLGTTGVGSGVAIPHGKFEDLDSAVALFMKLDEAIDYDAVDDRPVDLIFMLLAPEDSAAQSIKDLARISKLMRNDILCAKLRRTDNPDALYALLTDKKLPNAA